MCEHFDIVACDGDVRKRCRSAFEVEQAATAAGAGMVVAGIARDSAARHVERAAFSDTDAAAAVIGRVAGDDDVCQVHGSSVFDI